MKTIEIQLSHDRNDLRYKFFEARPIDLSKFDLRSIAIIEKNLFFLGFATVDLQPTLLTIRLVEDDSGQSFAIGDRPKEDFYFQVWKNLRQLLSRTFEQKLKVAVIGCKKDSDRFTQNVQNQAYQIGQTIASLGLITLTGGLSGVMEKSSEGAFKLKGDILGIIPGSDSASANPYVGTVICSGMGIGRNYLIAQTADFVIALNGGRGTLEEICYSLDFEKPVLSLGSWDIPGVKQVQDLDSLLFELEAFWKMEVIRNISKIEDETHNLLCHW